MNEGVEILPAEVEKFSISKESLKSVLGENLGGDVESIEVSDGGVRVSFSTGFLNGILGKVYQRRVETIDVNGEEVKIKLGERTVKAEKETTAEGDVQRRGGEENKENENEGEAKKKDNDLSKRLQQIRNAL